MIYLDHAATSNLLQCAYDAMMNAPFGNPSSEHDAGQNARTALEQARKTIAECIGASPSEVYFTSGATEGMAMVAHSIGYDLECSPFEHHAVTENCSRVAHHGYAFAQMLVNNETGEIFDVAALRKDYQFLICDATAALGHVPVDVRALACDYLFGSGHKFGAPKGIGFVYAKSSAPLYPIMAGGGQERLARPGTENLEGACAMAAALEWQMDHMDENIQHLATLRQMMFQALSRIPDHKFNTPMGKPCAPHILNVSFDGVDAHALSLVLSKNGVMVSAGAACSNGLNEPSHVIMAMYGDEARARSAIRVSFSHQNTTDEIAEASQKIADAVEYLRRIS